MSSKYRQRSAEKKCVAVSGLLKNRVGVILLGGGLGGEQYCSGGQARLLPLHQSADRCWGNFLPTAACEAGWTDSSERTLRTTKPRLGGVHHKGRRLSIIWAPRDHFALKSAAEHNGK